MIKVVLDTNILVSGSLWLKGKPNQIIELIINRKIEGYLSPQILAEYESILAKNFSLDSEEIRNLVEILADSFVIIFPRTKLNIVKTDPKDNIILECALEAKTDYIISGDKHLLNLKEFKGMKIVSAKEFLEICKFKETWM